jgi:hypothetical protein
MGDRDKMSEERIKELKQLGTILDNTSISSLYGFEKIKKGLHLDNRGFVFNVLTKIHDIDKRYIDICKPMLDSLQLPILEIDDTLDHSPRKGEEILASETIKSVNPAMFFNKLLDLIEKNPQDSSRFIKAGKSCKRELEKLLGTPPQYDENKNAYLKATDKSSELEKLAAGQILKGYHLRVYFYPTVYIVDPHPSEKNIERIACSMERTRGIELLAKDVDDLDFDRGTNGYNPILLIKEKYKNMKEESVKEELLNTGNLLLDGIPSNKDIHILPKYSEAVESLHSYAQVALTKLEEKLETSFLSI